MTGAAVKSITGTEPIQVDSTTHRSLISRSTRRIQLVIRTLLTSDTRVMSEKAIDEAFKQHIGTVYRRLAASLARSGLMTPELSPGVLLEWLLMGAVDVKGPEGPQGPAGPAPGLQDPAA